jgi:hypothetical protein
VMTTSLRRLIYCVCVVFASPFNHLQQPTTRPFHGPHDRGVVRAAVPCAAEWEPMPARRRCSGVSHARRPPCAAVYALCTPYTGRKTACYASPHWGRTGSHVLHCLVPEGCRCVAPCVLWCLVPPRHATRMGQRRHMCLCHAHARTRASFRPHERHPSATRSTWRAGTSWASRMQVRVVCTCVAACDVHLRQLVMTLQPTMPAAPSIIIACVSPCIPQHTMRLPQPPAVWRRRCSCRGSTHTTWRRLAA